MANTPDVPELCSVPHCQRRADRTIHWARTGAENRVCQLHAQRAANTAAELGGKLTIVIDSRQEPLCFTPSGPNGSRGGA